MKTRLRKNETENTTMRERMEKMDKELKTAREALARGGMEGEFSRVLNLDDPKEKKLYESEEKLRKQHAKEVYQLREEIDRLASELYRLENMSSRDSRQNLDRFEDRLVLEKRKFMQEIESMRREHDDEKAFLHLQISERYEKEHHNWEAELHKARMQHQAEMTEVVTKYEQQLLPMQDQIKVLKTELAKTSWDKEAIVKDVKLKYDADLESLQQSHFQQIQMSSQVFEKELQKMEDKYRTEIKQLETYTKEERVTLEEHIARLKDTHDSDMAKALREHEEQSADLKKENAALKSQVDGVNAELDKTWTTLENTDARNAEKIAILTANYDKKIDALLADQGEKIEVSRKQQETEHASRIRILEAKLQKADENSTRAIERLEQDHLDELANSATEMEDLKKKLAEFEGTEGHYKMRLADEKEKRKNAVRKFQVEREKRILLEQQYATAEEPQE
jgi:hypothetical protein